MHFAKHTDRHGPNISGEPDYFNICISCSSDSSAFEQCSALAHSQDSLWCAKLSTQKRSIQKPVILGFDSVMGLSLIRAYIMCVQHH